MSIVCLTHLFTSPKNFIATARHPVTNVPLPPSLCVAVDVAQQGPSTALGLTIGIDGSNAANVVLKPTWYLAELYK